MNIVMFTNTYLPQIGGVANSVEIFRKELVKKGHKVLIVAPQYEKHEDSEENIIRLPSMQKFNGSDFSLVLPIGLDLKTRLKKFNADLFHAHHPFLLGDLALRLSSKYKTPLVFTHHTMYEYYTHYVPINFSEMGRFIIELSKDFANMCDGVIAPSESIRDILQHRGIDTVIDVIPTGIDTEEFKNGNPDNFRKKLGISKDDKIIGHVGRLAEEKNLSFLAESVAEYISKNPDTYFLVVGEGESKEDIKQIFTDKNIEGKLCLTGGLTGDDLINAYHAMDIFVMASKTETQGMVLAEALSAGKILVALDAPGSREIVEEGVNGHLVYQEDKEEFAKAINKTFKMLNEKPGALHDKAISSAKNYTIETTGKKLEHFYNHILKNCNSGKDKNLSEWDKFLSSLKVEWNLWANRFSAFSTALKKESDNPDVF